MLRSVVRSMAACARLLWTNARSAGWRQTMLWLFVMVFLRGLFPTGVEAILFTLDPELTATVVLLMGYVVRQSGDGVINGVRSRARTAVHKSTPAWSRCCLAARHMARKVLVFTPVSAREIVSEYVDFVVAALASLVRHPRAPERRQALFRGFYANVAVGP